MRDGTKEVSELFAKVRQLESELAKYKACAVIGGDRKPIGVSQAIYFFGEIDGKAAVVMKRVHTIELSILGNMVRYGHGPGEILTASNCYSTAEAVPEGGAK